MKMKCITILDEQEDFIKKQSQFFCLSKFVQHKLSEYIKQTEEMKWQKDI
jgi:hypothetical protein